MDAYVLQARSDMDRKLLQERSDMDYKAMLEKVRLEGHMLEARAISRPPRQHVFNFSPPVSISHRLYILRTLVFYDTNIFNLWQPYVGDCMQAKHHETAQSPSTRESAIESPV